MASYNLSPVNGLYFPPFISQKDVDKFSTDGFSCRPQDVFVASYPKSGSTWTQHIIAQLATLQEGGVGNRSLSDIIPFLEKIGRDDAEMRSSPRYLHTHFPYNMMPGGEPIKTAAKYIYIARNPKDVAVSFYYHTKRFDFYNFTGDWNNFFELFMKGEVDFGLYFDHVLEWWKHRDADNILFLKYEDMKKDLPGCVKNISQFMGYDLDESVIAKIAENSIFDSMKDNPMANPDKFFKYEVKSSRTPFLRKGIVGDWRNHFSDEQSARLDAEYAKRMTGSGLDFEF